MKFRPSLDGFYKRSWEHNERYETIKRELRQSPSECLAQERARLEPLLTAHVHACYDELYKRTRCILCNPTWRRLILLSKWACIQRRVQTRRRLPIFFDDEEDNLENHEPNKVRH